MPSASARKRSADPARALVLARQYDSEACRTDPVRFVRKHVTIEQPDGSVIPFGLWPFQAVTLGALHAHPLVIVLKARRLGLSWLCLGYALWLAMYQPGSRILMLCKRLDDAREMVGRIRRIYERMAAHPLHAHLVAQFPVTRDSHDRLDIGPSVFRALPATPAAARSETAALWLWDEAAFVEDAASIMQGALPTIEGGGRAAIISTGNGRTGRGEEFARQWTRARMGESGWEPLFWPWMRRPGRDEAWKARMIADLGDPERFRTEYPEVEDDAFLRADALYVFRSATLAAAGATHLSPGAPRRFGLDVAREGKDRTVLYRYEDGHLRHHRTLRGAHDLMAVVGMVQFEVHQTGIERVVVDATGMGAGVLDRLSELGTDAVPFYAGGRALNSRRFVNRRAESAWTFRTLCLDGALDLDPEDHVLQAELGTFVYSFDSAGRIALESKKDLLSRGLPSPDHGDAAIMAACGDQIGELPPADRKPTPTITADLLDKPL